MISSRRNTIRTVAEKQFISDKEKTFQYDESLPALPVPKLHQTLQKYLTSIKHLATKEEYSNTCKIVEDFQNGIGKQLQEKLEERALQKRNWLAEWWLKYAYLSFRQPISPSMNMVGIQSLHFTIWDQPSEATALEYSSLSIWAVLQFYNLLRNEKLMPQHSRNGDRLSMNQFRNLFNTTRIPKEEFDELYRGFKTTSEGSCPGHIIVLCYGHIWHLDPWESEGNSLSAKEIEQQLKYIWRISESLGDGPGIAALTADYRDLWAKNRRWLSSLSAMNADYLSLIESAMCAFTLDENSPRDLSEVLRYSLCGEPQNRWADKSYGGISFKNGYLGNNCDHTPCDAMVSVAMGYFQHELLTERLKQGWTEPFVEKVVKMPQRLLFDLDDFVLNSIKKVKEVNASLRNNIDVIFYPFPKFGKLWLKESQFHPDAFIQCALQLAYYEMHHKFAPTYETATTRRYYMARTETIRSCTPEVAEWVQAMASPVSSIMEKRSKLINAVNRHRELALECEAGLGIDRHMLGLGLIAIENGMDMPELFTDTSFVKSGGGGNYVLSTSTVGYTYVVGGVTAMVKDGYGVFYGILPNRIHFMLSHFKSGNTCLRGLAEAISSSLVKMQEIVGVPLSTM